MVSKVSLKLEVNRTMTDSLSQDADQLLKQAEAEWQSGQLSRALESFNQLLAICESDETLRREAACLKAPVDLKERMAGLLPPSSAHALIGACRSMRPPDADGV